LSAARVDHCSAPSVSSASILESSFLACCIWIRRSGLR
jgi:hypothetical protein